MFSFKKLFRT